MNGLKRYDKLYGQWTLVSNWRYFYPNYLTLSTKENVDGRWCFGGMWTNICRFISNWTNKSRLVGKLKRRYLVIQWTGTSFSQRPRKPLVKTLISSCSLHSDVWRVVAKSASLAFELVLNSKSAIVSERRWVSVKPQNRCHPVRVKPKKWPWEIEGLQRWLDSP